MQNKLLLEGLSDAIGFVGGALLGFWIGRLLGLDIFADGYSTTSVAGIALVVAALAVLGIGQAIRRVIDVGFGAGGGNLDVGDDLDDAVKAVEGDNGVVEHKE